MSETYNLIQRLTSNQLSENDKSRFLTDFAKNLGWRPSDQLNYPEIDNFVNANLIVEHGLEHSSVITFLNRRYKDLGFDEKNKLISISYNNLVDWHITVDTDTVCYIYNRMDPPEVIVSEDIERQNLDYIRSDIFERIIGKKPSPNIPALDQALIDTVSFWKRNLGGLLEAEVSNKNLAALFNTIIFLRAIEDYQRKIDIEGKHKSLIEKLNSFEQENEFQFNEFLISHLKALLSGKYPNEFLEEKEIEVFSSLSFEDAYHLTEDFYRNKYASFYKYDFSLISKHALSNIYEHYVTLLRYEETQQLPLFHSIPFEQSEKKFGAVYTPQYIARFFGRFLESKMPASKFKKLKILDPACGSGIFLRTILELQCDITRWKLSSEEIKEAFSLIHGYDIDENATHATKLSLSLLYLILLDDIPSDFNIKLGDTIDFAIENTINEKFDAIICNPPYVAHSNQEINTREKLSKYLAEHSHGKTDLFLAFIKYSIELLKAGGYGMFVIPHSFLFSRSAKPIREFLQKECWIRFLADMSSIRVFGNNDVYVILLIFQKKGAEISNKEVSVLKCQEFPGLALQDVIDEKYTYNDFYSFYEAKQEDFEKDEWLLIQPNERILFNKFNNQIKLKDYLEVRTGFISGNDDVFIINKEQLSRLEKELFKPFLPDRSMSPYAITEETDKFFFYPYRDENLLDEETLIKEFPKTWKYLQKNRKGLESRKPVENGDVVWWKPTRPRLPKNILVKKIVTPHLVITPKFSLDETAKYMITRSPLLYLKEEYRSEDDLYYYFLAVLNSSPCFWYISNSSHKYNSNYLMLEPKTLKEIPIPDPKKIDFSTLSKIIKLCEKRLYSSGKLANELEYELDILISNLYGLNKREMESVGVLL